MNPAGSKLQKYNLEEIRMLRDDLHNTRMTPERTAVLKGLLWLFDFVQDDNNFVFIFHNYITMLYEVSVINDDPVVRKATRRIINNEARRALPYLDEIFTDSYKQKLILIVGILQNTGGPADEYLKFYRNAFSGADVGKNRVEFYQAAKKLDYDALTDALLVYSHLRFAYDRNMEPVFGLPSDQRDEIIRACSSLPYVHTIDNTDGYHDQGYFVTHAVFVLNGYGEYALPDNAFARSLKKYIQSSFNDVRTRFGNYDLVGEYVECMKMFGLGRRPEVKEAEQYILLRQCEDGSWLKQRSKDDDPYDIFHPSWTSITALHYKFLPGRKTMNLKAGAH